jgi:integrase
MYGSGLRLRVRLRLRAKDLDLDRAEITLRERKRNKDRRRMLPTTVVPRLMTYLVEVRRVHDADLAPGYGSVYRPDALDRKLPGAAREYWWQYGFPSGKLSTDPRSGAVRRNHAHELSLSRAVPEAVLSATYPSTASEVRIASTSGPPMVCGWRAS